MGVNESSLVLTVNESHELGMISWQLASVWPKMSERGLGSKWQPQLSLAYMTLAGARQRWNLPKWLDGGSTPLCFVFEILKGLRAYIFIFIEVYVYVYVYATGVGVSVQVRKEYPDPLELKSEEVVNHSTLVLGTKPESLVRVARAHHFFLPLHPSLPSSSSLVPSLSSFQLFFPLFFLICGWPQDRAQRFPVCSHWTIPPTGKCAFLLKCYSC